MTMPADKLKALTEADKLISSGEQEIKDGKEMQAKDPERSAKLIKQGEEDRTRGQAMLDEAKLMK